MTTQPIGAYDMVRYLGVDEIADVAGAAKNSNLVCKYEIGGKCYYWDTPYNSMAEIYQDWADRGRELAAQSKGIS